MRVLQAMAGARHGGAEAFFLRLTAALARAGEEQLALVRHPAHEAALRRQGVATRRLPFGGILDFVTRPRFRRAVETFRPDIVLTWMSRATRLCPRGDFVHVARLGGYYDLRHYRHCDHLIGNTQALVRSFRAQGWPEARTHYLPNFVAAATTAPADRAGLGIPPGAIFALALGRLHPNKGFDTLLSALAAAPGIHLRIAGEGPQRAALARQANALGLGQRAGLLGWRDDAPALLAAADFLVCPSRSEPLGNVVIEAWAAGIPVLASASEGPAELIAEGRSGLLVPPDDQAALAAAMLRLAGYPALRAALAAGGRAAYDASFTEPKIVAAYRDFFVRVGR